MIIKKEEMATLANNSGEAEHPHTAMGRDPSPVPSEGTGEAASTSAAATALSLCSLLPAAAHYHHLFIP